MKSGKMLSIQGKMGGNKGDVGRWEVKELMCMFCGRNFGRGEEQWDTEWYQNNHFSLGWPEKKCKNVLAGFCDCRDDAP